MSRNLQNLAGPFQYCYQKTVNELKIVLAIEPIIINLIALVLCGGILLILGNDELSPHLGKYHNTWYHIIQLLAGYQVIISAKKSVFLPLLTIGIAAVGILAHHYGLGFMLEAGVLKEMMMFGIIGAAVTVFYMR